jgi:hypothetical protein
MNCVVVDANIARACNDLGKVEVAVRAFEFLAQLTSRANDVSVVLNDMLEKEWLKHQSRTFISWWTQMETRGSVKYVSTKEVAHYRLAVDGVSDDGVRNAMRKDFHLVELAVTEVAPIASYDEKQRRYVGDLVAQCPDLQAIQWVNPLLDEKWEEWIAAGFTPPTYLVGARRAS